MVIKNIPAFIETLEEAFPDYRFNFQKQGSNWARAFITHWEPKHPNDDPGIEYDERGGVWVTFGRLNFEPVNVNDASQGHTLYGLHGYGYHGMEYQPSARLFWQFDLWLATGLLIDPALLLPDAKRHADDHVQKVREGRASKPVKRVYNKAKDRWQEKQGRRISYNVPNHHSKLWRMAVETLIEQEISKKEKIV